MVGVSRSRHLPQLAPSQRRVLCKHVKGRRRVRGGGGSHNNNNNNNWSIRAGQRDERTRQRPCNPRRTTSRHPAVSILVSDQVRVIVLVCVVVSKVF